MDSLRTKRAGFPISHIFPVINSNIFPFSFPLTVEAITIRIFHRQNICDSSLSLLSRAVSSFCVKNVGKHRFHADITLEKVRKSFLKSNSKRGFGLFPNPKWRAVRKKNCASKKGPQNRFPSFSFSCCKTFLRPSAYGGKFPPPFFCPTDLNLSFFFLEAAAEREETTKVPSVPKNHT